MQSKETLIIEVKSRPVLWREDHPHYRRKDVTDKLWMEVAASCGFHNGNIAKTKWKSLKDQFRREVQKMPKCDFGNQSPDFSSKWQYFGLMWFIKDFILPSRTQGNLGGKRPAEDPDPLEDVCYEEAVNGEISQTELPIETCYASEGSVLSHKNRPKLRKIDMDNEMLNFDREKLVFQQKECREKEEENSDISFFRSLLPYMQEFTMLEKLHIRNDIQNVILSHYSRKKGQDSNSECITRSDLLTPGSQEKDYYNLKVKV